MKRFLVLLALVLLIGCGADPPARRPTHRPVTDLAELEAAQLAVAAAISSRGWVFVPSDQQALCRHGKIHYLPSGSLRRGVPTRAWPRVRREVLTVARERGFGRARLDSLRPNLLVLDLASADGASVVLEIDHTEARLTGSSGCLRAK